MRCLIPTGLIAALAWASAGCDGAGAGPGPSAGPQLIVPPAPSAPAGPVEEGEVMAVVNGRPIFMKRLHEVLVRGQGLVMAQQLIADELVRQEAEGKGVTVSDQEVRQEHQRLLEGVFPSVSEAEQRERMLGQFLSERGMSLVRWDMIARRNALLRKLAEPKVQVTEEQVRQAFGDRYGRKAVVRHIEVESLNEAERVLDALKDGEDFAELARKHSKNPTGKQGGLLPPLSKDGPADMPEAIRAVALALSKPGELSDPVKVGYAFHILRLERVIDPGNVEFDKVRAELEAAVREQQVRRTQQQLLMDLMGAAKYELVDPLLRELNAQASAKD